MQRTECNFGLSNTKFLSFIFLLCDTFNFSQFSYQFLLISLAHFIILILKRSILLLIDSINNSPLLDQSFNSTLFIPLKRYGWFVVDINTRDFPYRVFRIFWNANPRYGLRGKLSCRRRSRRRRRIAHIRW